MAVVNLDDPSDVAAWNCRAPAPASQPVATPAGMEPYAQHAIWHEDNCTGLDWTQYHDASDPMPKTWDNEAPDVVVDLFTASQAQAMLAAVPRNAPLYSPDDVAFPVQRSAEGADVPPELASIAKQASIAAAEVAAPSGAAREPLTEEQMHKDLAALCKRTFNARIGKACSNCDGGTYQSDNKGYGQFHRCNKCRYVPMWGEDGRELGAPIAATQKGGQHGTD